MPGRNQCRGCDNCGDPFYSMVYACRRDGAQGVIDRFAVGTKWEVAICDRQPEMAVLHAGPTHNLWFGVAFFAVYSVAALAYLVNSIGAVLVWARA